MQCLLDSAVSWDGIADAQRMLTFFFFYQLSSYLFPSDGM